MAARSTTGRTGGARDGTRGIASRVKAIRKTLTPGSGNPQGAMVEVRIEIPRGSRNKYEYDDARQALRRLPRVTPAGGPRPLPTPCHPLAAVPPPARTLDEGCLVPRRALSAPRSFSPWTRVRALP
jgi:hypothetical protein